MNSDKVLEAIPDEPDEGPFVCDYCDDPRETSVFVNYEKDSVICWSCIRKMNEQLDLLQWLHGTDWNNLSRQ